MFCHQGQTFALKRLTDGPYPSSHCPIQDCLSIYILLSLAYYFIINSMSRAFQALKPQKELALKHTKKRKRFCIYLVCFIKLPGGRVGAEEIRGRDGVVGFVSGGRGAPGRNCTRVIN